MRKPLARKSAAILSCLMAGCLVFSAPVSAAAKIPADKFVRTANYFLKAGVGIPASDHEALAKYDVLVLPAEAQVFNQDLFADLRRRNPHIIILAYVPTKSYDLIWNDALHADLKGGLKDEWKLRDGAGNGISVWPNTYALNIASGWSDYLGRFTAQKILSTGLWDGVFYDEESATISWLNGGNLDLDLDGVRDDAATADRMWKDGMLRLMKTTRALAGNDPYIVVNGDSDPDVGAYANGRMFETFPTPWEGNGSWSSVENNYLHLQTQVSQPPLFIINGNTANTGNKDDYAKVRFGLTSALLGDAVFSFDYGDADHGQLWMYDEYGAYLGKPLGPPTNMLDAATAIKPGLWRRDFERGVVLVNSTDRTQTADFNGDFEHLHGSQDPNVNNGEITNSVDVPATDGLILLRPIDRIVGASYRNGAFLRILDGTGAPHRTGFFSYVPRQHGGTILGEYTPSDAGASVMIAAKGNRLEMTDGAGNLIQNIYPFGQDWKPGIGFSLGKVGGKTYVAVASGAGGPPMVRLYDEHLNPLTDAWSAYSPKFGGGVNVAVGDVYGDGRPEIITGAGPGGGPHVRVFNLHGEVMAQFFAYDQKFRGGVNVGVGDVDGSGQAEIVTGTGFGGAPQVKVFNSKGQVKNSFFAYDSRKRGGVRVTVADVDGDGRAEIIAMTNDVFTLAYGSPKPSL